jgi:hypothetical protein
MGPLLLHRTQLEEGRRLAEWSDEERRLFMELFLQVRVVC